MSRKTVLKRTAALGGLTALVTAGSLVISAPSASALLPPGCTDGIRMWNAYFEAGYRDTANALLSNLIGMGCLD